MNCHIQEAGSDWLSTNERVALHHSVLVVQFQSSEVSRGCHPCNPEKQRTASI